MKQQHSFDRHERVNALVKDLAAAFIQIESNSDPLITVTSANISPNYRNATIFITTIPDGREEDALIFLKRHGGDMRTYIKKHSKFKTIPRIDFAVDAGERHRQHIDRIASEIKATQNPSETNEAWGSEPCFTDDR